MRVVCFALFRSYNCNHCGEVIPVLPDPPSRKPVVEQRALVRALGGVLAFLSIPLALLGIAFHQRVGDLVLASIVGIFALRVLLLWLAESPQRRQPVVGSPSTQRVRPPLPSPAGAPAAPSSPSQSLSQQALAHHGRPGGPLPPGAVVAPPLQSLPRSIRPQRPRTAPALPAQPASPPAAGERQMPPALPPALRLPSPYATELMPPLPGPPRRDHWQYDDGDYSTGQQEENAHGPA